MNALVLVAHGSRLTDSNREAEHIADQLARSLSAVFKHTVCAFLELTRPSLPESIDKVVALGAEHVTVLPYFLAAGRHVSRDIPEIVDAKRAQYPQVTFSVADYLGLHTGIVELLRETALVEVGKTLPPSPSERGA